MVNRKTLQLLAVGGMLSALVALGGCTGGTPTTDAGSNSAPAASEQKASEKPKEADAKKDAVSIDDWAGTWNDFATYLDAPEVAGSYQEVGDRDGKTAAEVKSALLDRRHADFHSLVIGGGKVVFLDGLKDKGGKETGSAEYTFKQAHKVKHENAELEWDEFEGKGDAPYKVLLMMPIHGEEVMTHFHMRYGDNADELLKKEDWYPTFVKPSTTFDQIKSEITE